MFSWSESIQILFFQWHDSDLCQLWIKPHMEEMHCISCFLALDLHVIIYQRSARTRASKSGWVAAWWRMPATYIAGPSCASHTISAALCHAHKSSMWCAVRLHRGTGVCSHRSTRLGRQWLTNKKHSSPQVAFSPLISHAVRSEVAENQLSFQKGQKSFLWAAQLLYLFIFLIYHTPVTSLISLNLTNRLPRTQSIWLSSANKLFAMCLLSKKDMLPPSYNPEKDSVNMFYQLIIIIKKPPVFF